MRSAPAGRHQPMLAYVDKLNELDTTRSSRPRRSGSPARRCARTTSPTTPRPTRCCRTRRRNGAISSMCRKLSSSGSECERTVQTDYRRSAANSARARNRGDGAHARMPRSHRRGRAAGSTPLSRCASARRSSRPTLPTSASRRAMRRRYAVFRSRSRTSMRPRGIRTTCASKILGNFVPPYDATVIAKLRDDGRGVRRQGQHGRIRDGLLDREFRVRADAQSARSRARRRRIVRRLGRGGRGAMNVSRRWAPTPADRFASPRRFAAWSGIKPTYSRVSRYGVIAYASSLDQVGPFTKTVRDAAIMLRVAGRSRPTATRPARRVRCPTTNAR